jgi:hypothetical protein
MPKATKIAYTAKSLAEEFDTTPKELRKFFRSAESGIEPVGKGSRYTLEFTPTQAAALKKKYTAWSDAAAANRAARAAELAEIKAAKELNVLTVATPTVEDEGVDTDDATDEESGVEELTDDEFADMIAEIESETDEVEA